MSNFFSSMLIRSIGITCKGASFVMFAYQTLFLTIFCEKYPSNNPVAIVPSFETLSPSPRH
jgi:hypothetical protein